MLRNYITTLLHLQLVSKRQLCPKNPQRITLTFGHVIETSLQLDEVPFFASKCPFLKEGTMPF
jgi:hypothetical protein